MKKPTTPQSEKSKKPFIKVKVVDNDREIENERKAVNGKKWAC